MTGRERSPDELAEDLAEIKRAVEHGSRDTRMAIEALVAEIKSTYVRQDVYARDHTYLTGRMAKLEGAVTWAWRTGITALVLPVLVGIVITLLVTGGAR